VTVGGVAGGGANAAAPTVSLIEADVLAAKLASPEYCAVIGCEPAVSEDVVSVACPPLTFPLPIWAPLSKKVTNPLGAPLAELATVAVNVSDSPLTEGFCDEATVVVVELVPAGGFTV